MPKQKKNVYRQTDGINNHKTSKHDRYISGEMNKYRQIFQFTS